MVDFLLLHCPQFSSMQLSRVLCISFLHPCVICGIISGIRIKLDAFNPIMRWCLLRQSWAQGPRTKQLSTAATPRGIGLCACVSFGPNRGAVSYDPSRLAVIFLDLPHSRLLYQNEVTDGSSPEVHEQIQAQCFSYWNFTVSDTDLTISQ